MLYEEKRLKRNDIKRFRAIIRENKQNDNKQKPNKKKYSNKIKFSLNSRKWNKNK